MNRNIETLNLKSFEHELSHLFSITFWIHWSFSHKNSMFRWINSEFIRETIFPDLFHVFPRLNDTWFNWIWKSQDSSHLLGFISNVFFFSFNPNHLPFISRNSYNWWKFYLWLLLSRKICFDNSWSVIYYNIFFWHLNLAKNFYLCNF